MRRVMEPRNKATPAVRASPMNTVTQGEAMRRRQPRRGVGTEADEGRLAERGQAADAGKQHQPEGDQRVEPDVVEQGDVELGQHPGRSRQQHEKQAECGTVSASFLFLDVARRQRAPEQHRNDQGEHDHFLEGAGVEGGIGFEQADQHGPECRHRVDARPPMMAPTKPLSPIRKPES